MDLKIVCSEWDIGHVSEILSLEDELVLEVTGYKNHPDFDINVGPIGEEKEQAHIVFFPKHSLC